jgi:hypothetical protein
MFCSHLVFEVVAAQHHRTEHAGRTFLPDALTTNENICEGL